MVVREWRGRADPARENSYPAHFRTAVLPELRLLDGFLGASLCRREVPDGVEFLVLTRWRSIDAVRRFAGAEPDRAVVEPGAVAALTGFDDFVRHYEVIEEAAAPAA